MHLPRSIASAAIALAIAVAIVVPAQAGLAATRTVATPALVAAVAGPGQAQRTIAMAAPAGLDAQGGSAEEDAAFDDGSGDVPIVDGTDATGDDGAGDVLMVDGTDSVDDDVLSLDGADAVGDDSDLLADDSSSSGAGSAPAVRRDRTSGRWARVAAPTAVRAMLTGASRAGVTWRAAIGGMPALQYVVQLRAGASLLRTTTFPKARSATLWGLAAGRRYTVTVTAVASDGTRRSAVGIPVRTPAVVAPKRTSGSTKPAGWIAAKRTQVARPR